MEDAIANGSVVTLALNPAHDWYSLREAMNCFEASSSENTSTWTSLIQSIENVNHEKCSDVDFTVVLRKEKQKIPQQTRSPPKNQ